MTNLDDDVRLTLLHTSDWHLGRAFASFADEAQKKLRRQRYMMVENIISLANQRADVLLVAGDIFDESTPPDIVWEALSSRLQRLEPTCHAFLMPGNHDPVHSSSPFHATHPFRANLPPNVHVIDTVDFAFEFPDRGAVLHAVAVTSNANAPDAMLKLPTREPGDDRIRIGMCHGQTFSFGGGTSSHPISAAQAAVRGFDYVALGDYHEPNNPAESQPNGMGRVDYCGTPESLTFGEPGAGYVLMVGMRRHGRPPRVEQHRVGYYRWRTETCESLRELVELLEHPDLDKTVLRLNLEFSVTLEERRKVNRLLQKLRGNDVEHGRVEVLESVDDRVRISESAYDQPLPDGVPDGLHKVRARLHGLLDDAERGEHARAALQHLHALVAGDVR